MKKLIMLACTSILLATSTCASAGAQQEKMKTCNKEASAKSLKGDERKAFMKSCLSNKPTTSSEKTAASTNDAKTADNR